MTGKVEKHSYEKGKGSLRMQLFIRPGQPFLLGAPHNEREISGVDEPLREFTGYVEIFDAVPGALRGRFSVPYHLERWEGRGHLVTYADVLIEGCFSFTGKTLRLVDDISSYEALQEGAAVNEEKEKFRKKNEAFLKKQKRITESLKKPRDPKALAAGAKQMQALQKEALQLAAEGERVARLGVEAADHARERAQRVWEILGKGAVVRPEGTSPRQKPQAFEGCGTRQKSLASEGFGMRQSLKIIK
jgi:hypothetical protein